MKFLITMLLLVFAFPVFSATLSDTLSAKFEFNRSAPGVNQKRQLGTILMDNRIHVARATYDFAVLGGAVSTLTLKGDNGQAVVIPNKALIMGCYIDVATPATTSASGTIAINSQAAGDIKTATAAASYTGVVACAPTGTAASAIKLTADRTIQATIATGAITAGKFTVFIEYITGSN